MTIPDLYIKKTCNLGGGVECCSFLVLGRDGFGCAKDSTGLVKVIETRRKHGTIGAMGDNCDGWAVVKESN